MNWCLDYQACGWFTLIAGAASMIVACSQGWPSVRSDDGTRAVVLLAGSIALLSAPVMLREMKRHGIG